MAGRPPRNNRNPRYANTNNRNDNNRDPNADGNPPPRVSLSQVDLMAIATIVATAIQGLGNTNGNGNQQPKPPPAQNGIKYHYESLHKNRCPVFKGDADPEKIPEALKVEVIIPFLEDKASKWWETVSPTLTAAGAITWQQFRDVFLKQYFPAEVRLQKLSEFENFSQTPDMSVVDYTSRFNDLGTYAPTIMADEVLKMHRYKKGLSSRIQSSLAVYQPTSFADLMGAAIRAETDIKRREDENKNKRPFIGLVISWETTIQETKSVHGATHSFISKRFTKKLGLTPEILVEPFRVTTPTSKTIETHRVHRKCKICIHEHLFQAELIQLNMVEFDIILGMDWLERYNAMVDCKGKSVRLRTPDQKEVVYHGKSKERK
ncbi:uncharacterized protein LOC142530617 [Primulina tabacum]|uniref:uncharacterized protein LOC142530617 n=1 Tax=Primulina tabacum TaxID=48773 RepID=UPI003F59B795